MMKRKVGEESCQFESQTITVALNAVAVLLLWSDAMAVSATVFVLPARDDFSGMTSAPSLDFCMRLPSN